jgi:glycosyltransferase involved in cell wall biosynthesis
MVNQVQIAQFINKYDLLPQSALVDIYNIADAFVFPTRREGESLGLVAIEAMACGTPVIACDFAAPKYYVVDDYNGYKFPVNDFERLGCIMNDFVTGVKSKNNLTAGCLETANRFENKSVQIILKEIFEV